MSSSPTNPVPTFHRWYAWTVLFLVLTATTTTIALRWLAPYIAVKVGNRPVAMSIIPTPEAKIPDAWRQQITNAQQDVFVSAGLFTSEVLANELDAAARRGVSVVLILPLPSNNDPAAGLRGWLASKQSPIEVVLDPTPFTGTVCIIDGTLALVTSQPLASTEALAHLGGFFASVTDKAIIQELRKQLRDQVARSQTQ